MEEIEHLPTQERDRDEHDHHRQQLPEAQAATVGFEASRRQTQNVQGRKTENHSPQNVINILPRAAHKHGGSNANQRGSVIAAESGDGDHSTRSPRKAHH